MIFKKIFQLGQKVRALFSREVVDEATLTELERVLYEADLGSGLTQEFLREVKKNPKDPLGTLRNLLLTTLGSAPDSPSMHPTPHVILIVGINGSGKTTSLAKLASHFHAQGKKVLIAAADTFRAASVEQLERWASLIGVDIIKSQMGADPAAVVFDALAAAKARKVDLVLVDTAGRLQNREELMRELEKIRRICSKQISEAPHETLLVLDATLGQNAIDQAATFHKITPLTGIVLSKLDGSAKGGAVISVRRQVGIPIRWIGTGESLKDLEVFNPQEFVEALLR